MALSHFLLAHIVRQREREPESCANGQRNATPSWDSFVLSCLVQFCFVAFPACRPTNGRLARRGSTLFASGAGRVNWSTPRSCSVRTPRPSPSHRSRRRENTPRPREVPARLCCQLPCSSACCSLRSVCPLAGGWQRGSWGAGVTGTHLSSRHLQLWLPSACPASLASGNVLSGEAGRGPAPWPASGCQLAPSVSPIQANRVTDQLQVSAQQARTF